MHAAILYIRLALSVLVTVCVFIGTFGSQYIMTLEETPILRFYLYKETSDGETTYFTELGDSAFGGCMERLNLLNATLATGVIGCASMLVALTSAIFLIRNPNSGPLVWTSRASQFLALVSIALCIVLDSVSYRVRFCDDVSAMKELFGLDYGFVVIIFSTALLAVLNIFELAAWCCSGSTIQSAEESAPLYG